MPEASRRSKLYKINIYNGRSKLLETSPVASATFATDQSGEVRFVVGETKELKAKSTTELTRTIWQLFRRVKRRRAGCSLWRFADNSIYVSDSTNSYLRAFTFMTSIMVPLL